MERGIVLYRQLDLDAIYGTDPYGPVVIEEEWG